MLNNLLYLLEISLFMIFKTQAHKWNCHIIFVVMLSHSVSVVGGIILVLNFFRFKGLIPEGKHHN